MHHAWIFHGPEGVGKFTTAVEVARVLLCHESRDTEACGQCESCRLFASRPSIYEAAHPDLHLIYKELARDSDFRDLRERKQLNIPLALVRERVVGGWV